MRSAITRHYTNGIYTGTTHVYTLFNRQNQRLVLSDSFGKVEELAKLIDESIFPRLYKLAADQYNAGQAIISGPVEISKAGITISRKTYPWSDVKEVSIHRGILKVSRKEGGWFSGASASASSIPNLGVLLTIIHQVVGLKAG
jgi:exonuclease I